MLGGYANWPGAYMAPNLLRLPASESRRYTNYIIRPPPNHTHPPRCTHICPYLTAHSRQGSRAIFRLVERCSPQRSRNPHAAAACAPPFLRTVNKVREERAASASSLPRHVLTPSAGQSLAFHVLRVLRQLLFRVCPQVERGRCADFSFVAWDRFLRWLYKTAENWYFALDEYECGFMQDFRNAEFQTSELTAVCRPVVAGCNLVVLLN